MTQTLFFEGIPLYAKQQAALQKWIADERPMQYDYQGSAYVLAIFHKNHSLHIKEGGVEYIYTKEHGGITFKKTGDRPVPWEDILQKGRGKTLRFHIPDQTHYILEAIGFVAISALTLYAVYKIREKYFPPGEKVNPRQKYRRRF